MDSYGFYQSVSGIFNCYYLDLSKKYVRILWLCDGNDAFHMRFSTLMEDTYRSSQVLRAKRSLYQTSDVPFVKARGKGRIWDRRWVWGAYVCYNLSQPGLIS